MLARALTLGARCSRREDAIQTSAWSVALHALGFPGVAAADADTMVAASLPRAMREQAALLAALADGLRARSLASAMEMVGCLEEGLAGRIRRAPDTAVRSVA